MINILVPMAGPNRFDDDEYTYPKPLVEIAGKPMIQRVVERLDSITGEKRFVFVVNSGDCDAYHLDDVLRLLVGEPCVIVRADSPAQGAACSCLMAIDHIDNDDALIISNSDHLIDSDMNEAMRAFESARADAGVLCFDSVHPKWSFVRLENGRIVEAAEKRPLSRHAVAGFYYFRHGKSFVAAAMRMIEKQASVNGLYFVAPSLNELVLKGQDIRAHDIPASEYHNLYSPHKVREYERWLETAPSPAAGAADAEVPHA